MEEDVRQRAIFLAEEGDSEELFELIKPYIEAEDIYALHLYANFSLDSFNESEEDFIKRHIELKTRASEGGIGDASYRMGVNHLYGDDVKQSYTKSAMYFERAIAQGHSYTKFTFGYSLYYGTYENPKNEGRGIMLMRQAAKEGVKDAVLELKLIADKNA